MDLKTIVTGGLMLTLFLCLSLLTGCAGKSSMSSPQLYGQPTTTSERAADDTLKSPQSDSSQVQAEEKKQAVTETTTTASTDSIKEEDKSATTDTEKVSELTHQKSTDHKSALREAHRKPEYYIHVDNEDSASAVDDDLWRLFDLAEEYYAMGVIANREASWEEAQYYFEKCFKIMANLDVESDSLTPEAVKYSSILDNLVSDYRVTLRSLGTLEEDVTPSVLLERFNDVERQLGQDTMRVYNEETPLIKYDLPIVMNDRVKKSIIYFQTVARDAFEKYLTRSKKYEGMFREVLTQYGLPHDLIYLSLVESGFNPNAYSWARAMGLWQFISSTGRLYGLHRNWWLDERKDPIKSTHAACRFLKDLYEQFGSWELAMAAYNGGPRRVEKSIKKQKTIDFWQLNLKRQTMDYVPLIYAATIIAKEPEKYGFYDIDFEDPVLWDEVEIDKCLDLKLVAKELGCSYKELKNLNPELLRQYTPPNTKNYKLKIPRGAKTKFFAAYDGMPSPKETSWVRHRINRGETVSTIAAKYGVSQYSIFAANNLSRYSKIYAGKELIVPVPLDREYSGSKKKHEYVANNSIYNVRSGDTMWDIARAFGTTVDALRRLNYIERGSRIYVGQKLKIPSSATKLATRNSKSPLTYASKDTQSSSSGNSSTKKYKVRSGDTLWDIARKFGTTTSRIRSLNGLGRSSRIYPGQVLTIGSGSGSNYVIYRVRRGDTLSRIAKKYRTSISRILANNGITDPDNIQIGDNLKIYLD